MEEKVPTETTPTPSNISNSIPNEGLTFWLKGDAGIKTDDHGRVSQWNDQSPNGNNVYQTTIKNRPMFVSDGFHGKPVIQFNGSNYLCTNQVVTNGQDYSVFVVSALGNEDGVGPFYNGNSSNSGWGFCRIRGLDSYGILDGGTDVLHFGPIQNSQEVQLLSATRGSGTTMFYSLGVLSGTSNATLSNPTGVAYVGSLSASDSGQFKGPLAEIIVYDRKLNDEERRQVEAYLAAKYGFKIEKNS